MKRQDPSPPKPKRRWRVRFSLRTLLLVMLLAPIGFWLGMRYQEARRQRAVIAEIWEGSGGVIFLKEPQPWPTFLDTHLLDRVEGLLFLH